MIPCEMCFFLLPSPCPTHKCIHSLSRPHREGASTLIWTHLSSSFCVSSFPISQPCSTSHSSLSITASPLHRLLLPLQVRMCLGLQLLKYLPWTLSLLTSPSLSSHLNFYPKIYNFLASYLFFNPVTLSIAIATSRLTPFCPVVQWTLAGSCLAGALSSLAFCCPLHRVHTLTSPSLCDHDASRGFPLWNTLPPRS